jgi:hypothetical protein
MPGACPGTTNHVGGTRIRRRFAVTSDGARAWIGWHDATLDLECRVNLAADGSRRCLPMNWNDSDEYFTDPGCMEAAYTPGQQDRCTSMPYVMRHVAAESCGSVSGFEFYELGEAVAPGASVYRRASDGVGCTEAVVSAETALFRRGAAVPSSTFVPSTATSVPGVGRIGGVVEVTEDGSRQLAAWTDGAKDNVECRITVAEDGVQRCVPSGRSVNSTFADASCSMNALKWTSACNLPPPLYATRTSEASCGSETLAVGAQLSGPSYSGGGEVSCVEQAAEEGSRLYQVTPLPPTDFMEVTDRIETSAPGRLKPRYHTTPDGGCWFSDFWDAELMAACSFARTSRNEYRCLPGTPATVTTYYADSACTQAVPVWNRGLCAVAPAPRFVTAGASQPDECAEALSPLETSPFTGPAYRMTAGTCTLLPDTTAVLKVTPVELSRFVAGTVMVE